MFVEWLIDSESIRGEALSDVSRLRLGMSVSDFPNF